ncbi:hypothetical protein QS257_16795 [Terrilactibacillus sp. S3-3]|nr:hypothetical protein QS257_16795 [Terrilactibacillus sp. S3-3]
MEQETFNFAVRAIELKHYNFKILKDVGLLTHKMGAEDLQVSIQQLALECYPDSRYLKEYTIWGEKKKKIALVYSPFSGSNVKALIRSVPDRLKGKYEINIIEPKNDLTYLIS